MSDLDHELRRLLSRKDPPAGFAERVLRRAEPAPRRMEPAPRQMEPAPRPTEQAPLRVRVTRWAMAAALVAAVAGAMEYRERQQRAAGEAARKQVVQALQIAGSKLQLVQTKIGRLHESGRNR